MLDHLQLTVKNVEAAAKFYQTVLEPFGYEILRTSENQVIFGDKTSVFSVASGEPKSVHFAFQAESRAQVDKFYQRALAAGGLDNGAPGVRTRYHENYYAAFIIDPDGYRIEAVCHNEQSY